MKNDVTYVAILIAFFALSILFVFACEKIIGPDESGGTDEPGDAEHQPGEVAA